MQTAQEIIAYLETELEKAQTIYNLLKADDKQRAMIHMVKVAAITEMLEEIKK